MGRACNTNGAEEKLMCLLVGKPEGKGPIGRTRHRWVNSIKLDLGELR
jgi:hypothetical protein